MANDPKPDVVRNAENSIDNATDPAQTGQGTGYAGEWADVEGMEREQRQEAGSSNAQNKGILVGSLLGGIIGLVVLLPLAFIPIAGFPLVGRLIVCGIVGALAGGTAGVVYFGGRMPELQGETVDAGGRPSRGSTPRDSRTDDRGR